MVSPATAPVPVRLTCTVRSVSLVGTPRAVELAKTGGTLSVTEVIAGADGALVSSVTVKVFDETALWLPAASVIRRSEERRVGKECGSRWALAQVAVMSEAKRVDEVPNGVPVPVPS